MTTPKTSAENYLDQFAILSAAAVGVVLTRTREPQRVTDALLRFAHSGEPARAYHEWDCLRGWQILEPGYDPLIRPAFDKTQGLLLALKKINDIDGDGSKAWKNAICAMVYPHWEIGKTAQIIQCLKHYSIDFTEGKTRLVLIVPEGYNLPKELENDIVPLDFTMPTRDELQSIYSKQIGEVCKEKGIKTLPYADKTDEIIALGTGLTVNEFHTSVARALVTNRSTFPATPLRDFTSVIQRVKTEVVKRSEVLEVVPPADASQVGGYDLLFEWLREAGSCFSAESAAFGADKPKGISLIGPPGTGKTLLCQCISSIFGLPLIRFDISRVFASHIGESEGRVDSAIKLMQAMAPCVLWFDEVDKAGLDPRQASGDGGVGKRVIGKILTTMSEDKSGNFWVMSANRTTGLPPEMLRRGRLDMCFSALPPVTIERKAIFDIHVTKRKQDPAALDMAHLCAISKGFVGAEIEAAVADAVKAAWYRRAKGVLFDTELVAAQFKRIKPISVAFPEDFNAMVDWAKNNAQPTSTPEVDDTSLVRTRTRNPGQRSIEM